MRSFFAAALILVATALPALAEAPAPGFSLRTLDGRSTLALEDLRDKRAAVLVFWASW